MTSSVSLQIFLTYTETESAVWLSVNETDVRGLLQTSALGLAPAWAPPHPWLSREHFARFFKQHQTEPACVTASNRGRPLSMCFFEVPCDDMKDMLKDWFLFSM